ncbi:MAG: hypothetical protein H7175_08510, partial [Burkholderiales bacterium]|nr:hypothetical protein [Anaerolineae bacterium]
MDMIRGFFKSVGDDLRNREHLETYLLIVLVVALFILDLFGDVLNDDRKLTLIIASLLVLIFKTRKELKVDDVKRESDRVIKAMNGLIQAPVELDQVLQDRQSYAPFREFVQDATVLWVYGASGINVLKNTKDINSIVGKPNGQLRVIIQDPTHTASMNILHQQLDKYNDLQSDIQSTMFTLTALAKQYSGKMEHRLLDYSPGFSLLVVDPDGPNGRLSVEFYGYR